MRLLFLFSLVFQSVAAGLATAQVAAPAKETAVEAAASPAAQQDPDVQAIEAAIASYTEAFNKHDPAAVVAHFTNDGELTTGDGTTIKGHDALKKDLETYFAAAETAKLVLSDVSVNVIAPSVAIESGTATIIEGEESQVSTYRAVHVKGQDGWKLNRVQDDAVQVLPPSNYERLKTLEWMVGTWELDSGESPLVLSCRWTTNQNFLVVSYSMQDDEGGDFQGSQIIGWDPAKEIVRSWVFDSDGGFGGGAWSNEGNTWTVKTINVVPDGSQATSTNIYRLVDQNTIEYRSVGRQVGGKLLANVPTAQFVRRQ